MKNSEKKAPQNAVVDLQYEEVAEEPIVNWDGPVRPDSQRAHRSLAFHFVYSVHAFDYEVSLDEIIENYKKEFGLEVEDNAFSIRLARGAIDKREELDAMVAPRLEHWKLDRLSFSVRLILRIALWERLYTDSAPSIIINEAIELCKAFGEEDSYRLVNGLLDELFKTL